MASAQGILASTSNLQQNAQAALPVIPNNGNPGGAYNMPQTNGQSPATPAGPDLSWLQPSAYMTEINNTLQKIQQNIDASSQQLGIALPATTTQQQAFQPQVQQTATPVLPQQQAVTQPNVVLPQTR